VFGVITGSHLDTSNLLNKHHTMLLLRHDECAGHNLLSSVSAVWMIDRFR